MLQLNGSQQEFFFPVGLLGFASVQHFVLSDYQPPDGSQSPFYLLQASHEDLSFLLLSPHLLVPEYRMELSPQEIACLNATSIDDLVAMVIITFRDRLEETTANLQGPVLLNLATKKGFQIVVENYPVRHRLLNHPTT